MQTQEWTGELDREKWPEGEWDREPQDRLQWQDPETGLPCLAVRNHNGAWCGYVGVSEGHPLYAKDYNACLRGCKSEDRYGGTDCWRDHPTPESLLKAHGGITYSNFCHRRICHVVEGDEKVWWFGFDCSHCDDMVPNFERFTRNSIFSDDRPIYKNLDYVKSEVTELAQQLKNVKGEFSK